MSNPNFFAAPPPTRRDDLVEVLHGVEIADPYRWLEKTDDPATAAWVKAQNAHAEALLGSLPGRTELHERLTAFLRAGSSVACSVAGDRVFSLDRWGLHDQAVLVVRDARTPGPARALVDPHTLTGDQTAAIDWYHPSPDGRVVAYGVSVGGDERSTLQVIDVETGDHRSDRIPNTRAASVAWLPDGSGFAYTRYPSPDSVPEEDRGYWRKVFWHTLGDNWHRDDLVFGDLPDKTAWPNVTISEDGRWLLVHLSLGWSRVDVHLIDRLTGARTVLIDGIEATSSFEVVGDRLVGVTTLGADRGRVVVAPLAKGWHNNWSTIVAESDAVLEGLVATSSSLLVLSTRSAVSRLDRYDFDGTGHERMELPEIGSIVGLSGHRDRDEAFFSVTSFTTPPTMFRWAPDEARSVHDPVGIRNTGKIRDWSRLSGVQPDTAAVSESGDGAYVVEQLRYPSTDGTEVAMFLIRAAATDPSPDTPCILTAYGGFAVTMGPVYSAAIVEVCNQGGLYVIANIRGGSEEGETWHRAGMREHKQQSFDDFFAAADWLVTQGLTSRARLAIRGGSNGGLLMGAAITQRPDLCQAAQVAVPLLDMLRYHHFLIARLWIPEYGDPDTPTEFAWLHAYSPYHHVVDGSCFPAVLLTSAEGDSRVDPSHARKMAARLQDATSCGDTRPILLREEGRAGHGQGKPVSKQADELADVLGFLFWQLGLSRSSAERSAPESGR